MARTTDTFESGLPELVSSMLADVHTATVGQIISFDADLQTCSVQPCLKRKYAELDEPIQLPVIEDVPVLFPGSGNFYMTWDVKADSYCWLMFSERSLAVWLDSGGIVDPASKRKFNLSDCVAFVGLNPNPSAISTVDSDAIVIRNLDNSTYVKLEADAITLKNADGDVSLQSGGTVSINNGNFTVDV